MTEPTITEIADALGRLREEASRPCEGGHHMRYAFAKFCGPCSARIALGQVEGTLASVTEELLRALEGRPCWCHESGDARNCGQPDCRRCTALDRARKELGGLVKGRT